MQTFKKRSEFQRVQKGRKWVTPAFILQGLQRPADETEAPRFGFTVSSKAVAKESKAGNSRPGSPKGGSVPKKRGMAVDRNRARRRLKEVVRLMFPALARPGFDYAVIGRMAALTRNFGALLADMETAFHKVHQDQPPKEAIPAQKRSNTIS
jgi:ribonuclease P protein component